MTKKSRSSNEHGVAQKSPNKAAADKHLARTTDDVAVAAYFKAQARSFEPGHELDDWVAAESELANH